MPDTPYKRDAVVQVRDGSRWVRGRVLCVHGGGARYTVGYHSLSGFRCVGAGADEVRVLK